MTTDPIMQGMLGAAHEAGRIVLAIYREGFETRRKGDGTPVTAADLQAEAAIIAGLMETGLPVLGEESVAAGRIPELGHRFFVVDPLDGTKEFIKRNDEFSVNIALVENGVATRGVVLAPALGIAYSGGPEGAFRHSWSSDGGYGASTPISVSSGGPMRIVASRSHGHEALAPLCVAIGCAEDVSVGSALKFGLLAEGRARLYPRFTPTCEWDTAAGQAVLEAAGGAVLQLDGAPLRYGKAATGFLNPFFAAAESPATAEMAVAEMRRALASTL